MLLSLFLTLLELSMSIRLLSALVTDKPSVLDSSNQDDLYCDIKGVS